MQCQTSLLSEQELQLYAEVQYKQLSNIFRYFFHNLCCCRIYILLEFVAFFFNTPPPPPSSVLWDFLLLFFFWGGGGVQSWSLELNSWWLSILIGFHQAGDLFPFLVRISKLQPVIEFSASRCTHSLICLVRFHETKYTFYPQKSERNLKMLLLRTLMDRGTWNPSLSLKLQAIRKKTMKHFCSYWGTTVYRFCFTSGHWKAFILIV